MTASAADPGKRGRWRRVASGTLLAVGLAAGAGCRTATPPPPRSALEPLPTLGSYVPDAVDHLARDAAVAGLASDRAGLERIAREIEAIDDARRASGERPSGLAPYVLDLRNATLDDAIQRRRATRALLDRDDLDPALRSRLEAEAEDDPIHLAQERLEEARLRRIGRIFNALVEPAGRSLLTGALFPYRLSRALVGLAVSAHLEDELTTPERQALAHWKRYIEEHPDTPEAAALLERVEEDQLRWYRTQRDHLVRSAERALEAGRPTAALLFAEQALRYAPEDRDASAIVDEARRRIRHERAQHARSVTASSAADLSPGRALAVALLVRPDAIEGEAQHLLDEAPEGPLADEARFARALARFESGAETEGWEAFEEVARRSGSDSNMSRHAWARVASSEANPYRMFQMARSQERSRQLGWLALGPLASGPADRDLPRPVEWMIDLPVFPEAALGVPNRLIRYPWAKPRSRAPAVFARRYLERYPDGERAPELRAWLESYEAGRGNWVAAAELAEQDAGAEAEHLTELHERAAQQILDAAGRVTRRDVRLAMLRETARQYPGTRAGRDAGEAVRTLLRESTPQHIRISRGFLRENPGVAGPGGLALRPEFLDGDLSNGELHPQGITLLGGRVLELAFVNERGEEEGDPVTQRQTVSEERLARLVAALEESAIRAARTDPDYDLEPDADRDLYFERVRLGLADSLDARATAQSSFAFLGMRERYGLVRSRESVLPVDLVIQVSGTDLGLGAFPRMRPPRSTPDSILYE